MNNLDLNLKDTFDFLHHVIQAHTAYNEEVDEAIQTLDIDNAEVIEAFDYYNDDEQRLCSLILLRDSIRYVTCTAYGDTYVSITSQSE